MDENSGHKKCMRIVIVCKHFDVCTYGVIIDSRPEEVGKS